MGNKNFVGSRTYLRKSKIMIFFFQEYRADFGSFGGVEIFILIVLSRSFILIIIFGSIITVVSPLFFFSFRLFFVTVIFIKINYMILFGQLGTSTTLHVGH